MNFHSAGHFPKAIFVQLPHIRLFDEFLTQTQIDQQGDNY